MHHENKVLEAFVLKGRDREAVFWFMKRVIERYDRPITVVAELPTLIGGALRDLRIKK